MDWATAGVGCWAAMDWMVMAGRVVVGWEAKGWEMTGKSMVREETERVKGTDSGAGCNKGIIKWVQ